jgi:dihydroxyacetone kinase-like protein
MSTRSAADQDAAATGPHDHQPSGHRAATSEGRTVVVTAAGVRAFVVRAERALVRHRRLLDRLDAQLGDGDHGENMTVGFGQAVRELAPSGTPYPADATEDIGELVRRLGYLVTANVGGAGGSLYGTALTEAGFALTGSTTIDADDLARAFDAAAGAVARRGRCREGDKTIFDALQPAATAYRAELRIGRDPVRALRAAARAARAGMYATRPMRARRGLALRLGDRSRGHQDPGATSCFLLVRAMLARAELGSG